MEIRKEINDFYALADMVWSGATDTIADIQNANKGDEFMIFLEGVFYVSIDGFAIALQLPVSGHMYGGP